MFVILDAFKRQELWEIFSTKQTTLSWGSNIPNNIHNSTKINRIANIFATPYSSFLMFLYGFQEFIIIYENVRINSNLYKFHEKRKTHCNLFCRIHIGGKEKIIK
jgi:hypothetical protein